MASKVTLILLFIITLTQTALSQDMVKLNYHYAYNDHYKWTKKQAARELKKNKFWGEFKKGDVIADIGAYSCHIDLAISLFYEGLTFYLQETQADRLNKNGFYEMYNFYSRQNGKAISNQFNFVIGNNYQSNLPDSSCDKILMNNVFEYISRYDLYLAELKGKLKKGGKLYIKTDNVFSDDYFIKITEAAGYTCEKNASSHGWHRFVFNTITKKENPVRDIFDAVIHKDFEKTKAFLDNGISANSSLGKASLLQIAGSISNNQKIIQLLIDRGANMNAADFFVYTPLGKLAAAGEVETIKLLLQNGTLPTQEELLMAAWFGHNAEIVKLLVEKGAKIYGKDAKDYNILFRAALSGDLEIVQYLLNHSDTKDIHFKNENGQNIMHWIAHSCKPEAMKYVLEDKGFDMNEKDKEGNTVLMHAVFGGSMDMVKYLVEEKKINLNEKNKDGFTALHYAIDPELNKYLVSKGAN